MPSVHEDQASFTVFPIGDNMPKPVTTTRFCVVASFNMLLAV